MRLNVVEARGLHLFKLFPRQSVPCIRDRRRIDEQGDWNLVLLDHWKQDRENRSVAVVSGDYNRVGNLLAKSFYDFNDSREGKDGVMMQGQPRELRLQRGGCNGGCSRLLGVEAVIGEDRSSSVLQILGAEVHRGQQYH